MLEQVFAWPGMGRVAVDAAFQRDYSMFLAVNLIFGTLVVLGNLVADILYALVDPRVRLSCSCNSITGSPDGVLSVQDNQ